MPWCILCRNKEKDPLEIVTYHAFPKDLCTRQLWISVIGIDNLQVTDHSTLCSHHFNEDSFYYPPGGLKVKRHLKPGSVPSIFGNALSLTKNEVLNESCLNNEESVLLPKKETEDCDNLSYVKAEAEITDPSPENFLVVEVTPNIKQKNSILPDSHGCGLASDSAGENSILRNILGCSSSGITKENSVLSNLDNSILRNILVCDLKSDVKVKDSVLPDNHIYDLTCDSAEEDSIQPDVSGPDLTSDIAREHPVLPGVNRSEFFISQLGSSPNENVANVRPEWMSNTNEEILTKKSKKCKPIIKGKEGWKPGSLNPRYIGDFKESDFEIPHLAARNLEIVKKTVTSLRKKVKTLQKRNIRYRKTIDKMKPKKMEDIETCTVQPSVILQCLSSSGDEKVSDDETCTVSSKIEDENSQIVSETEDLAMVSETEELVMESYSSDDEPTTSKSAETIKVRNSESRNSNNMKNSTPDNSDKILQTLYEYVETKKQTETKKDEFDTFGNYVAVQLRQLPVINALRIQQRIQTLLFDERIRINCLGFPK